MLDINKLNRVRRVLGVNTLVPKALGGFKIKKPDGSEIEIPLSAIKSGQLSHNFGTDGGSITYNGEQIPTSYELSLLFSTWFNQGMYDNSFSNDKVSGYPTYDKIQNPTDATLNAERLKEKDNLAASSPAVAGVSNSVDTKPETTLPELDIKPVEPIPPKPINGLNAELGAPVGANPTGETVPTQLPQVQGGAVKTQADPKNPTPKPDPTSTGELVGGNPQTPLTGKLKLGNAMGAISENAGKALELFAQAGMGDMSQIAGIAGGLSAGIGAIANGGGAAGAMGGIGAAADAARGLLFKGVHDNDSKLTAGLNTAYDSISTAAMAFMPVGTIIGGAMKVGGFIGDALSSMGVGTDQMTTTDQILDSNFMKLTPIGLANALGAKSTDKFSVDLDVKADMGASYMSSYNKMDSVASKAGKKYGLFSGGARKKANNQIAEAKRQQNIITDINKDALDMKAIASANSYTNALNYRYNLNGGYDLMFNRAAKHGMKFDTPWEPQLEEIFEVNLVDIDEISSFKEGGQINGKINIDTKDIDWEPVLVEEFKEGGKTPEKEIEVIETETNLKSVIPDGALHKNKHHMEDADGLTKKGVPVVDNNGELQAEIELNEIIFTLEVTKELEKRYHEYYQEDTSNKRKDELALEAGKLLWHEILYNTEDRTGLINTLKKGGVLIALEGNKVETNELKGKRLKELALKLNPNFIKRLASGDLRGIKTPSGELGSVMISSGDKYVYPQIQEINGELVYLPDDKYIDSAWDNNDKLEFENENDAIWFGENYKKYIFPEYFKAWELKYNSYKQGGQITQSMVDDMVKLALINILTR